ncbi:hypothetical protein Drose_04050 [Dactylosporangium roseum]|uniref:Uncharacterized protein n=1 Tax=Dactylosporangium roseum TaxID=47989 RepID=A0ABY5Z5Y2_9ACTN|nr:hypothetical protein [Dactylosporangium roseum]UWZ37461.1 hypothetical protein Drose_04050 [Dactylosporangium roseum]
MAEVNLAVEILFEGNGTDEQFEAFIEEIAVQLDAIGREHNLAARIADRTAEIDASFEADTFEAAVAAFLGDVRTALHAVGCGTPDWPTFRPTRRIVRELQDA